MAGSSLIATIGYEGLAPPTFVALLREAGIRRVIDVRALANSRRPGFAKRALTANLAAAAIEYVHVPALGTPAPGREAVRSGRVAEFRAIFGTHLAGDEAQAALAMVAAQAAEIPCCLLCLEAQPSHCHRTLVAEAMGERWGFDVRHLHVDLRQ